MPAYRIRESKPSLLLTNPRALKNVLDGSLKPNLHPIETEAHFWGEFGAFALVINRMAHMDKVGVWDAELLCHGDSLRDGEVRLVTLVA